MNYEYQMVQATTTVKGVAAGQEAAQYLEDLVNQKAQQGWEFYRIDNIGVEEKPGCLGSLFGKKANYTEYYVVTFRRPTS